MKDAMKLEGDLIRLREERMEDMDVMRRLRNDLDTQAWTKTLPPDYTMEMIEGRHKQRAFSFDRDEGRFAIVWKETGECIGHMGYSNLDQRWAVTIGIAVLREFWGTGAAAEAQAITLRFAFEELGVRVVRLWTNSGNPGAVGLAKKAGFKDAFRGREAVFRRGEFYDNLSMDILRHEYYALHPELEDGMPPLNTGE